MKRNMLRVRVIRKYYNKEKPDLLVGYAIQNEDNPSEVRMVRKEDLKRAISSGQCIATNMTMTSDGRLIGRACVAPKKRNVALSIVEVYTNGRRISGAMTFDGTKTAEEVKGLKPGVSFISGTAMLDDIQKKAFNNVVDEKSLSEVKRKSFKSVRDKMLKLLVSNAEIPSFNVEKGEKKGEYAIVVENYNKYNDILGGIIMCLVEDSAITEQIKITGSNNGRITVYCVTGINDVRKIVKNIK